jgi:nicotinamidase-related amidase
MAAMILHRGRAALLVVDMQNDFVHGRMAVSGAAELAERLAPLVAAARSAGVPVVFVTQALRPNGADAGSLNGFPEVRDGLALREGDDGVRVAAELGAEPNDIYVVKRRFSAFHATDLDLLLRSSNIDQVIVCGVSAHICCDTTVRDAFQLGYEPLYVTDGVSMGDLPDLGFGAVHAEDAKRVVATIVGHRFATLCTIDDLIQALQ